MLFNCLSDIVVAFLAIACLINSYRTSKLENMFMGLNND